MAGGGILLRHRLDHKSDAGAEQPQKDGRAPDLGGLGQPGLLHQHRHQQHQHAGHAQLAHAQRNGVHLRLCHGLFRHQHVGGVAHGADQADQVAAGRMEAVVQRQQRQSHGTHDQCQTQLFAGLAAVKEKVQQRREYHRQGADEPCVGNGGIGQAVGGAGVYAHQQRADDETVPQRSAADVSKLLPEDGSQYQECQQKAEGVQVHGLQLRQAQIHQIVGYAPEQCHQHQCQIGFALFRHTKRLPSSF